MALTSDGKANDTKPMIADAVTRMWSSPVLGYFILRPWAYFGADFHYVASSGPVPPKGAGISGLSLFLHLIRHLLVAVM